MKYKTTKAEDFHYIVFSFVKNPIDSDTKINSKDIKWIKR